MHVSIPAAVEFQERNFVKNPRTIAILVLAVGLTVFGLERIRSGWKYGRSGTTWGTRQIAIFAEIWIF